VGAALFRFLVDRPTTQPADSTLTAARERR
jgi:hypothetical protein